METGTTLVRFGTCGRIERAVSYETDMSELWSFKLQTRHYCPPLTWCVRPPYKNLKGARDPVAVSHRPQPPGTPLPHRCSPAPVVVYSLEYIYYFANLPLYCGKKKKTLFGVPLNEPDHHSVICVVTGSVIDGFGGSVAFKERPEELGVAGRFWFWVWLDNA